MNNEVLILDVILVDKSLGREYWQDAIAIYNGELSPSLDEEVAFQFNTFDEFMESNKNLYDNVSISKVLDWYVVENK